MRAKTFLEHKEALGDCRETVGQSFFILTSEFVVHTWNLDDQGPSRPLPRLHPTDASYSRASLYCRLCRKNKVPAGDHRL